MSSKITKQSDTEATINVTLDETFLAPIVRHTIDHLRGRVKAAGFRPGKAPDYIVERELGAETIQSEVIESAVSQSYSEALSEHKLVTVTNPEVKVTKFVPYTELEYDAVVELLPKVKLAEYKKIKKKRPEVVIEKAEIQEVIDGLRKQQATKEDSQQPAKLGDELEIDFEGSRDGKPMEGGSAKGHTLELGSKTFIPGFEEQLVGLKAGESKDFDITFPKYYHEKTLAGETAHFKVMVNKVTEVKLPEVTDKFAKELGGVESVSQLEADIEKALRDQKAERVSREFEQVVVDEVVKNSQVKLPKTLVDQQIARLKQELDQNLASRGLDLEKYAQLSGKTTEDIENEMKPEAEKRVAMAMVLTDVAREEHLTITAEDVEAEITRLKAAHSDAQSLSELEQPSIREEVYNHLMATKVIDKLVEYVESH